MKLLVATEFPPDAPGGGPAVVRQMLRGLPGKVYWWSVRRFPTSPRIPTPRNGSGIRVTGQTSFSPGVLFPQHRHTRVKAMLMKNLWSPLATLSLCTNAARIQPDHCWLIPHDWSIFPLYGFLKAFYRRPPRVHTTIQDFPDIHHHAELWGKRLVQKMVRFQEEIYRRSDSRDATSVPMLKELQTRTGSVGDQMLHAGLEQEDFTFLTQPAAPRLASSPIRIAYAGTILVEEEFASMVRVLQKLRPSRPVILEIWSSHPYRARSWFDPAWMKEHGHVSEQELRLALRGCHWGFVPMAMSDRDPRYNRYSFPTKLITYLAAGLPILALGHPESSVLKIMEDFQLGIALTSATDLQRHDLTLRLFDHHSQDFYRPEIVRCARQVFDAARMRKRLWASFSHPAP